MSKSGLTPITGKTKAQAQTICEDLYSSNSNVGSELVGKNDWNQMIKWVFPNITKLEDGNGEIVVEAGETYGEEFFGFELQDVGVTQIGICEYEVIQGNIDNKELTIKATGFEQKDKYENKYKNIYDLAGNVSEYINADQNSVIGGSYKSESKEWLGIDNELYTINTYLTDPEEVTESTDLSTVGFRNILYIMPE